MQYNWPSIQRSIQGTRTEHQGWESWTTTCPPTHSSCSSLMHSELCMTTSSEEHESTCSTTTNTNQHSKMPWKNKDTPSSNKSYKTNHHSDYEQETTDQSMNYASIAERYERNKHSTETERTAQYETHSSEYQTKRSYRWSRKQKKQKRNDRQRSDPWVETTSTHTITQHKNLSSWHNLQYRTAPRQTTSSSTCSMVAEPVSSHVRRHEE